MSNITDYEIVGCDTRENCGNCGSRKDLKCHHDSIPESISTVGWCPRWCTKSTDVVNHPNHYTRHPSGVECIDITEHMNFNLGNAMKYIWRADLKNSAVEDLKKAEWYIQRELKRRSTDVKRNHSS